MNISSTFIYLTILLFLNSSCVSMESSNAELRNSTFKSTTINDTLKFTSGVRAIFKSSKGNYWFGSHNEGVAVFDGKNFRYYTINDGLPDNQICSIQEDVNGCIWIGTANGVCSFDGTKITNHSQALNVNTHNEWKKTDNNLWFNAGIHNGVYRYDGQSLSYLAFPPQQIANPDNVYNVTGIAEGKNNMLWIGTYAGVIGYNGSEFSTVNDKTLGLTKETGLLHIRSVFEDSKGKLWIGNNGIGVLLKKGDSVINFSEKMNLIHPANAKTGDKSPAGTLEHVFAIQEDNSGNIWFGDRDTGVWKFDGETMTNYKVDVHLSSQMTWCIYKDDENLLFGMANGGVYKFNGKSFDKMF
ncbi:MAG: diguanylate cyclase [Bacteroidetes bacterium 43-93]|nr:diguanylate cyclase [Bacteroidota bacterium]OJW95733.1 MAG: diguanylate cyclase [Bacteroidetes bacterium 43-93]